MQEEKSERKRFLEHLFKNRKFIGLVDAIGKRYGKLPHEILCDSTIFEFTLDAAIMAAGVGMENEAAEKTDGGTAATSGGWGRWGISYTKQAEEGEK